MFKLMDPVHPSGVLAGHRFTTILGKGGGWTQDSTLLTGHQYYYICLFQFSVVCGLKLTLPVLLSKSIRISKKRPVKHLLYISTTVKRSLLRSDSGKEGERRERL